MNNRGSKSKHNDREIDFRMQKTIRLLSDSEYVRNHKRSTPIDCSTLEARRTSTKRSAAKMWPSLHRVSARWRYSQPIHVLHNIIIFSYDRRLCTTMTDFLLVYARSSGPLHLLRKADYAYFASSRNGETWKPSMSEGGRERIEGDREYNGRFSKKLNNSGWLL